MRQCQRRNPLARKEPFIDLYTGDWMKDQAVSRCAPATRGIWIDLLCAMHDDARSGRLTGTAEQLARLGRCSTAEMSAALNDLQITGAADVSEGRNGSVTIINRRMYRLSQEREATRLRVAKSRSKAEGNGEVTPKKPDGAIDSDIDVSISFFGILPPLLDVSSFRERLGEWIAYKAERREIYKDQGLASMISRAASLAEKHGLPAVEEAMQRAIANRWAGWDQPNSFTAFKSDQKKPTRGAVTLLK